MSAEKTHFKKLRNPKYLGSYELMTGGKPLNLIARISHVVREEVIDIQDKDNAKKMMMVIHLVNQKPFICNSTNSGNIAAALNSPYIEDWNGKLIEFEVKRIRAFGKFHDALRVKAVAPKEIEKEDLNPQHERWEGAYKSLKAGEVTIEQIQKKFNINDENLKLLQDAK